MAGEVGTPNNPLSEEHRGRQQQRLALSIIGRTPADSRLAWPDSARVKGDVDRRLSFALDSSTFFKVAHVNTDPNKYKHTAPQRTFSYIAVSSDTSALSPLSVTADRPLAAIVLFRKIMCEY